MDDVEKIMREEQDDPMADVYATELTEQGQQASANIDQLRQEQHKEVDFQPNKQTLFNTMMNSFSPGYIFTSEPLFQPPRGSC